MRSYKDLIKILLLLPLLLMLAACGSAPDSKEDPLSSFDVDAMLPFATAVPEAVEPTPTPVPTVAAGDPTSAPLDWRNDKLPEQVVAEQNVIDDYEVPVIDASPTKSPTRTPTKKPANSGNQDAASYTSLHKGDESNAVKKMQQRLTDLNYYSGSINGKYGDKTVAAVKRFQSAVDLDVTGIATAETQKRLYSSNAPRYSPTTAPTKRPSSTQTPEYYTLAYGASGPEVWNLQERLKTLGYYTSVVDGHFGSGTQNAVKRFQKAIDYDQTGVATGSLQKIIFSKNAPTYKPAATNAATVAPVAEYVTLSQGSSGDKVKALQKRLKELGYFDGDIGGNYQTKTVAAVKRFQTAVGLEANGVATVETQKRLYAADAPRSSGSATAPPSGDSFIELSKGASGSRVEELQRRLKELSYYAGSVDGQYGDSTASAVRAFERAYDKSETGIATVALQKKLFSSDAKRNPNPDSGSSQTADYVLLKHGSTGDRVKSLQKRLKELGYFDGDIGGNYLDKTTAAVKRFQKAIGMEQDGVATVELQKRLFASDAPAYGSSGSQSPSESGGYRDLGKGSTGSDVENLQRRLKELKYYSGSIDGDYGESTAGAIMLFERAYGKTETGVATADMQKVLFSDSAKANPNTSSTDLKKGSTGEEVYMLQLRLIELGFLNEGDILEATYDKPTSDAVLAAQIASKYKKQDGVAYAEFVKYLHSDKAYEISQFEYGDGA